MTRILVTESNDVLRLSIQNSLRREGYEVFAAASGQEVIDLLARNRFHLLILDYEFEGMSAPKVLEALKTEGEEPPRAMVLSSNGSAEAVQACIRAGAKDFVLKPIHVSSLVERVAKLLPKPGESATGVA
ncbi:MAG: response regulator [bacterium]|nr:response regulator [bacterium]